MPRAGLSRERLVAQAAQIADAEGYEGLTLAALAAHFGVRQPSLYKHIDGLAGLRRDLAILGLRELRDVLAAATIGRSQGDALYGLSLAFRDWATSHPGRYAATVAAPDRTDEQVSAASDAALDVVMAVLAGYGLQGDAAVDAARVLRSAIHGFVSLESVGGFGLPRDLDDSYRSLVGMLDEAFSSGWTTRMRTARN